MFRIEDDRRRAVSETVGYVIILGLITLSISMVYFHAVPTLEGSQQEEHLDNTERAFQILQEDMEELSDKIAPSRSTELDLLDASLMVSTSPDPQFNVTVEGEQVANTTVSPVVYESHRTDTVISYEYGAVIRWVPGFSFMAHEPDWVINEDRVIIPGIITDGTESHTATNAPYVIRGVADEERETSTVERAEIGDIEVEIEITSEHAEAWAGFLEGFEDVESDDVNLIENPDSYDEVEFGFETSTVIYTETFVEMEVTR